MGLMRLGSCVDSMVKYGAKSVSGAAGRLFGLVVAVLDFAVLQHSLAVPGLCSFLHVTQAAVLHGEGKTT